MENQKSIQDSTIVSSRPYNTFYLTILGKYTDAVYSGHADKYFVYDDSARLITSLDPQKKESREVLDRVQGSGKCSRTLRTNLA
jgi:hypothetical protein